MFLKDFKEKYVLCEAKVRNELKRLRLTMAYKFQSPCLYESIQQPQELRCSYLNICGITNANHLQCLRSDKNILATDMLCISETKLSPDVLSTDLEIDGYQIAARLDHAYR